MTAQHTPDQWPEFEKHPTLSSDIAGGFPDRAYIELSRDQYNRARACILQNAALSAQVVELVSIANRAYEYVRLRSWVHGEERLELLNILHEAEVIAKAGEK